MDKQPYFEWDKTNCVATCILYDNNRTYVGIATCHPDDTDVIGRENWMRNCLQTS